MEKKRQSILKPDGRIPLQESIIPDFPEEDTATVTLTKSRRVSFGANFVKEFIVGSAVSAQFFSEYEQAVSSSDSSSHTTSHSEMMDQSSFQVGDNAINLCTKQSVQDQFLPLKRKVHCEKLNSHGDLNDSNNKNVWDFNVSNGSNIFTEKNVGFSNKPDPSRSSTDKQCQNKRSESQSNGSEMDETPGEKPKIGKFSSTIFFSADSPTADVEFTEGCIGLAKSILDKKKKEMTVYIKGTPKESKMDDKGDASNTFMFESDDSDLGVKSTKCIDKSEMEDNISSGNFSKCFSIPKETNDSSENFDESHGNIENVPFHTYSLNSMLDRGDSSHVDPELERSLFFPERSLTEMLCSDPLIEEKDNTEECDMDISSSDSLKATVLNEGSGDDDNEITRGSPAEISSAVSPCLSPTSNPSDISFLSLSPPEEGDRTSLGDRKVLSLLTEQAEESNCCWTMDTIHLSEDINLWRFSIPILKSSAVMKFKLMPPQDKSLLSFSIVLDSSLELQESDEYQLKKHKIGIEYSFGKLKSYFQRDSRGLDNVYKLPLFLDKMNLIVKKLNGILGQVIRILKEYPGSRLEESFLSFRIYSFPLLFSCLITVDMSDPFQLSENSIAVKKQFGNFNTSLVKSMFVECLGNEESLILFIAKLTEAIVRMESETGFVTKRQHIRLIQ